MDWIRLAIDELEKRNSISAGMARDQHRELLARIQELETAARRAKDALEPYYTISNNGTGIMAAYNILAALLNNPPLEKE